VSGKTLYAVEQFYTFVSFCYEKISPITQTVSYEISHSRMYDMKSLASEIRALRTIFHYEKAALLVKRELLQLHPAGECCHQPAIGRFTYRIK
jgi:hypothetical protein